MSTGLPEESSVLFHGGDDHFAVAELRPATSEEGHRASERFRHHEVERAAFGYPRLRKRVPADKAAAYLSWLRGHGTLADDPAGPAADQFTRP